METTELLTVKQTAQILGLGVCKIHHYIKKGYLSAERVLEKVVLRKSEVYEFKAREHKNKLLWMPVKRYMTFKGISRSTVSEWVKKGLVDSAYKDGRLYLRRDQGKRSPV